MKKLAKALVAFSFICVFTVPAFAVLITFDENGNGNADGTPLPFGVGVEPMSGLATLYYLLPFNVAPGDIGVIETSPNNSDISDLMRFQSDNAGRNGRVWVFSDNSPTDP